MADVENEKVGSISVASDGTVIASSGMRTLNYGLLHLASLCSCSITVVVVACFL